MLKEMQQSEYDDDDHDDGDDDDDDYDDGDDDDDDDDDCSQIYSTIMCARLCLAFTVYLSPFMSDI